MKPTAVHLNAVHPWLLLALAAPSLASTEDPIQWKDRRSKCPVKEWNAMEGQAAPSLGGLQSWVNTEALDWDDLRGNVVLLDMWGTWCPPCVKGIPHLKALQAKHQKAGLVVVGVHSKKGHAALPAFARKHELDYVLAADTSGRFQRAMHVRFFPTYYIIDRGGKMRIAGVNKSVDPEGRRHMDMALEAILAEPWEGERKKVLFGKKDMKPTKGTVVRLEPKKEPKQGSKPAVKLGPDGWPAIVNKKLYASNDLRGKKAPALQVERWLTPVPGFEGKVLLVDFWATWCGPCKRAMPHMQELHEAFPDDLVVVGLSDQLPEMIDKRTNRPWGNVVAEYLATKPFTYAQALDGKARLKSALGVTGIPHVMIISGDGVVRWQGFPGDKQDPLTTALVEAIIDRDKARRRDGDDDQGQGG